MITEAMQFLKEQFRLGSSMQEVQKDADFVHLYDQDKREVRKYSLREPRPEHTFQTLDGFVGFLIAEDYSGVVGAPDSGCGPVLVGREKVTAHLLYGETQRIRKCYLPLQPSPEWTALGILARGVSQAQLWKLLISDLHGCVDPALMLAVGSVKVSRKQTNEQSISNLGIRHLAGSDTMSLLVPTPSGDQDVQFATEYVFTVRRFQGFSKTYEVTTRLEIDTEDAVKFMFTPRRLPDVDDQARVDLAAELSTRLGDWSVFEGD